MAAIRLVICFLALALAPLAEAQQTPHIAYVYPAGGRQGAACNVVIGGQFLSGITNFAVLMDGDLARAKIAAYDRPLKPQEQQALKEELAKFQERRKNGGQLTQMDLARVDGIKRVLTQFGRRPANPAISEFMTLQLSLATNTTPGDHEIRVRTPGGLSNPLKFCVGLLPETSKLDWKAVPKDRGGTDPAMPRPAEATVRLPVTINGQIAPAGVDRYHFWAQRGRQIIIVVEARRLIPYLADAVPGWFEAALTIYDSKGNEVASAERYRFHPDPVIRFEAPHDGTYTVEIHDSLYRGREDFVYRLTIGELPFVTDIFPPGGPAGEKTAVELSGWNLTTHTLTLDNTGKAPGIYPVSITQDGRPSNPVPFAVDNLPEILEQEPDNSPESAQSVALPVIINGRINEPGDEDVFRFEGRAGQQIVAEVLARRLDSPLDSTLKLTDAAGKQLAFNDDYDDKGSGLETDHADSYLTATLPADGNYYLRIADAQHQGGRDYTYRLRVSAPRPDFALRVVPSGLNVRAGLSIPVTVFALRKDGFTNAIELRLKNAPAGFSLSGALIPANQDKAQFTLKAPPQAGNEMMPLSLEGSAEIAGQTIVHPAVPAEDMMQAFAYRHLVPARELEVAVADNPRPFASNSIKILSATPVKIPAGGTARVRVATPGNNFSNRFELELSGAPAGISIQSVSPVEGGMEIMLECAETNTPSVTAGNLIVNVLPKIAPATPAATRPKNQRRNPVGALPAIPFVVVAK
ncbi:MAG: PPC domain-containing protein [Verrucomicrobiota bacterium]